MQETVCLLGRVNDIVGVGQRFSRIKKNQVTRHKVKENSCKLFKNFITALVRKKNGKKKETRVEKMLSRPPPPSPTYKKRYSDEREVLEPPVIIK